MKSILLAILVITSASTLCFAAGDPAAPANRAVSNPVVFTSFTGKVESLTLSDTKTNRRAEISVADENGQKVGFVVRTNAVITGKDGNETTLDKVAIGDKVIIECNPTTLQGTHRADSIRVIE